MIREVQTGGARPLTDLAGALNARGVPTARGTGAWQAVQVKRVLDRVG
jgi:hypothetical protein